MQTFSQEPSPVDLVEQLFAIQKPSAVIPVEA